MNVGVISSRLGAIRELAERSGFDAIVITDWDNLYYLTGIRPIQAMSRRPDPMPLIISSERDRDPVFLCPGPFGRTMKEEHSYMKDVRTFESGGVAESFGLTKIIEEVFREWKLKNSSIGLEYPALSVKYFDAWKDALASNRVKNCSGLVEEMRMHKSKEEIEYLREGSRITDQVLEDVTTNAIAPGKTEMDIVRAIKSSAVRHGADDTSFHPQIPSGVRTHLFNITSTGKKLRKGEIVLLDYGIAYNGYCTDITRVVSVGRPTPEKKKVFEATKQIVEESIDSVKRGNTAEQVHDTALKWFIKTGYDGHVAHSTGHAMGLAVWERPFLREGDKTELKDGMVLAVEQGIYFTEFGMRLEQNLVVHGKRAEVFNKELEFIIV